MSTTPSRYRNRKNGYWVYYFSKSQKTFGINSPYEDLPAKDRLIIDEQAQEGDKLVFSSYKK